MLSKREIWTQKCIKRSFKTENSHLKTKERSLVQIFPLLEDPIPPIPWFWTLSLQGFETKSWLLECPVCSSLWLQPYPLNIANTETDLEVLNDTLFKNTLSSAFISKCFSKMKLLTILVVLRYVILPFYVLI